MNEGEDVIDSAGESDSIDRRNFPRSVFTYPAEFKLFSRNAEYTSFNGCLKDISLSGACLEFEDRYGRFNLKNANNEKVKISFRDPRGDKVNVFAKIRWIKKPDPGSFTINIGIAFIDTESWQLEVIEKLIGMRNKDQNMMWDLWEKYEK
ncbi:MAG: PilZ domain-containing protein [Nitrospirae bacterium]|nr:PilZ domain-containing protein [Nitrospirota bacterium]